jgi:hypothetical protein
VKRILLTFVLAIVVLLVSISPLLAQPEGGVLLIFVQVAKLRGNALT